ncbi:MAG: hypothetical protein ACD_46C00565G0002 [uncultured bacterium]|nr:MAG: hypothetical protein ACD_46C00565G0002 [uncultured bacterium]
MNLLAIKQHMMQVKITTLASLCSVFRVDIDTMRCLLRHWMCKGKIRQCTKKPECGSKCFQCPTSTIELYEWVEC